MTRSRGRSLALLISLLLVVAGVTYTGRTVRQARLDQALTIAVLADDPDGATAALDAGANANGRARSPTLSAWGLFWTPILQRKRASLATPILILATVNGHYRTVDTLLQHGADPNMRVHIGLTPLMCEAESGADDTNAMAALVSHGADPNARNANGVTALMGTAQRTNPDSMALLLDHGADPNARDRRGETALTRAAVFGGPKMLRLLLAHGAAPNVAAGDSRTPLMRAALYVTDTLKVMALLDGGADPTIKDANGKTAAELARDPAVGRFLRAAEVQWRRNHAPAHGGG